MSELLSISEGILRVQEYFLEKFSLVINTRRNQRWENLGEAEAATEEAAASEEILGQDRCIKQLALTAVRNAKFRSSQQMASPYTAGTAIQKERDFNS